ncbi:Ser/Thr protein phosphatase family protein [Collimonas arenae]|uniref:Ser/Thr protein phosphatase family protein n=1 Tax=Collimonas arenae TaxID=279058 RepID=A0A0A1F9N6_9BURK|nr:metallophosphoesterase [Collimonas arenae]AIY40495.1 Ser/Thr protein phosphatase family protein [Collimonas arenae]
MKISLLSDLHLSVHPMAPPQTDADVVVLAGDIWRPAEAVEWARQFSAPTLFVAGNHEFYGRDLTGAVAELRTAAAASNVHILQQQSVVLDGVRFLGCTLWSDFRFFSSEEQRQLGLQQAVELVRDFSRIRVTPDSPEPFTPAVSQRLFDDSVTWLEQQFSQPHDGPTVVISHHAPSPQSVHPKYAGSALNACFVSDLEQQILKWQPALWLHGHLHDSFDYRIGATRVVCNPRGYARAGKQENPLFDPYLSLTV